MASWKFVSDSRDAYTRYLALGSSGQDSGAVDPAGHRVADE